MADTLDLASIMRQLVQDAGTSAPGALQAASAGDQRAADLQKQRLDEGENFYRNYDQGRVNLPALMGFGAMMGPTKTGSFGESMSNAIAAGGGALQQQRNAEMDRFAKLQAIQDGRAKLAEANGMMKLQQLQRGLGMVGGLDSAQTSLANADFASGLAKMRSGVPTAPTSPVSGLTPLVAPDASAGAAPQPAAAPEAQAPSPFGALPVKRPGTPAFPIDHGAVTTTPPEMNGPAAMVTSGGDVPSSAPAPSAPPMPPPSQAQSPAPRQMPAGPVASDSSDTYMGEPLSAGDAQQLAAAYQYKQYALQHPTAARSAAVIQQADKIIDRLVPKDFRYDPATQRVVPAGDKAIGYIAAQEAAKQKAKVTSPDDTFATEAAKKQAESFQKVADELPNARTRAAQVEALSAALEKQPGYPLSAIQKFAAGIGIKWGDYASNVEATQALLSQLLPAQRQGMPGAVSDRDMAIFKSAVPSLMNTPEGNKIIVSTMRMLTDYTAKQSELAAQALNGDITRKEAARQMREMAVPIKDVLSRIGKGAPQAGSAQAASKPQTPQASAAPRYMARNPKTGQVIYSDDGSNWRPAP